jgi:F-type H+-transporting ATPase subunit alpha
MSFEIVEKLKKAIEEYAPQTQWESVGNVAEVGDGVVRITGLFTAQSQEILAIEAEGEIVAAVALNLEEHFIGALILGDASKVKSGQTVKRTQNILSIPVSDAILGRIIDPLGNPLDGLGEIEKTTTRYPLERPAPSVLERTPVKTPLHTGIMAIDAMIPIGRGQRELIIGDRQTGKTAIALDAIINQQAKSKDKRVISVYVAIGQKESKIARLATTLKEKGALKTSVIVAAPASSAAALLYLAPFAGTAIAEYFMDKGEDALVIYDDLTKHAASYRQISLLLRRPPGREAYPGDIFYLHSRLLERSAKLEEAKGGGSITALPIIETQLGDISAYVPTNVISITDGQIYLESDLFNKGIRPAINAGLSVSRVGSAAQTAAMKKVAGKLRLELAQFRELQAFVQFASDVDEATKQKIHRGELLTEILKQNDLNPIPVAYQTAILYGALRGYFDAVPIEKVDQIKNALIIYLRDIHETDIIDEITTTGSLSETTEETLKKALSQFDFTA